MSEYSIKNGNEILKNEKVISVEELLHDLNYPNKCLWNNCESRIETNKLFCNEHFNKLPAVLQNMSLNILNSIQQIKEFTNGST